MAQIGRIRREHRKYGWAYVIDLRPVAQLWSHRGVRITDEATANRILEAIRGRLVEGVPLEDAIGEFQRVNARPNLVPHWIDRWLELKTDEEHAGDRSPNYVRELLRYRRPGGEFSFFDEVSIFEITYGVLEDFSQWLAKRDLAPKTRQNVLGAFRSFLGWLHDREQIPRIPKFPTVRVPEHVPRVLTIEDLDRVLAAIPERERGIFLALSGMGLRPGEARALDCADYRDGWLIVDRAMKGGGPDAPIRGTKTGKGKRLPVPEDLQAWISKFVDPSSRLRGAPLFVNPRSGTRYSQWALRDLWDRACAAAGVEGVRLYEGTKHTMATDAIRRGVSERALQVYLGHADARSTRRYARLADEALVSVLRPRPTPKFVGALSVAENRSEKHERFSDAVAVPTGVEPVSPG